MTTAQNKRTVLLSLFLILALLTLATSSRVTGLEGASGPVEKATPCTACGQGDKGKAEKGSKKPVAADVTCPLSDMAHHNGFCDYYAVICPAGTPTLWQGPHGSPTGACGSGSPPCVPRFRGGKNQAHETLEKDGYKPKTPHEDKRLDWDPEPVFTKTAQQFERKVKLSYVTYRKQNKPAETIHAQIIEFEYTLDFGAHWEKFQSGFEIAPRAGVKPDKEFGEGKAKKVEGTEHYHALDNGDGTAYVVLTHHKTVD